MKTITIRLSDQLESQLKENVSKTGISQSEIVRKALEKYLAAQKFQQLRGKILPNVETSGLMSDFLESQIN